LQLTNRKSLAFISKRPGKTQQFNFFTVNDKPGKEKEIRYGDEVLGERDPDSFYIVDLPGFGYAKVPEEQRQKWASFMSDYLATRRTLKVVFHLIDGRHGPIDEDANIMRQVSENLQKNVAYVIVLTKADKNVKGASTKNPGKVSQDVSRIVRETMKANGVGNAPVILTSASTKLGRDEIWRFLRRAAEA
jgi:GTP-binding protein